METPILNRLTGTTPSDLLEQYMNAVRAVKAAGTAMSGVWPHARDYQGGSINVAMHEHAERCRALTKVAGELQIIVDALTSQI